MLCEHPVLLCLVAEGRLRALFEAHFHTAKHAFTPSDFPLKHFVVQESNAARSQV